MEGRKRFRRSGDRSRLECSGEELSTEEELKESQRAAGSLHAEVVSIVLEKQIKLIIF